MIKLKNVKTGYNNKTVLNKLSLDFESKGFYGIIGPNGAGKSTILKSILGYLPLSSGEIMIDGKSISKYNTKELAKKIAYVPQFFKMQFDYKVKDLILMGRFPYQNYWSNYSQEDYEKVEEVINYLDLNHIQDKHFSELSGGEQQRVSIARAFAQETKAILLDEAFSHLDINHQLDIVKILEKFNRRDKLIILISHNMNFTSEYCQDLVLLKQGELIAEGTPEEILNEENLHKLYKKRIIVRPNPISGKPNISYLEQK